MTVQFAAVHERNSWRKHAHHKSFEAAAFGEDGAVNLLRNFKRAKKMSSKYGAALAAFVWNDDDQHAHAFRLKPGTGSEIECVLVSVDLLRSFQRRSGPSLLQIKHWFETSAVPVHEPPAHQASIDSKARKELRPRPRRYRYGDKPTWEIVLDAVRAFDRKVSLAEVGDRIASEIPGFARNNLGADLSVLSVNCNSRGNHAVNSKPRRTDTGNAYDQLIRIGKGRGVLFDVYQPTIHGVWELADVGDKVLRPRFVCNADDMELQNARDEAAASQVFDPVQDDRRRTMATIVQREGQPEFRNKLLSAYRGTCVISGCTIKALLEAAHVVPFRGAHTNVIGNGLLLRADLHKLFDLHLICVDPQTRKLRLSGALKDTEYSQFEGVALLAPIDAGMAVLPEALQHHAERCGWPNAASDGGPLDAS